MQQLTIDDIRESAGQWTVHQVENPRPGQYLAEYHREIPNPDWPGLSSGIHIYIEQFRGDQVQFQGHAVTPNLDRHTMGHTKNLPDYRAAMACAQEWLRQAERFLQEGMPFADDVWWLDARGARHAGRVSHLRDLQTAVVVRHPGCTTHVVPVAALREA